MKKKIVAMVVAFVLVFSLSATAFAARGGGMRGGRCGSAGMGIGGMGSGNMLMWDEAGNFLNREEFEKKLDQYIADGVIAAADKDAYLAQYDYCAQSGGALGASGSCPAGARGRGVGAGAGRGRGMGRGR